MTDYVKRGLLSAELLDSLLMRWRRLGAPIAEALLPGLVEEEMRRIADRAGLRLPRELRVWWGWRNGVRDGGWRKTGRIVHDPSARDLGPKRVPLSLEQAVDLTLEYRRVAEEIADSEPPPTRPGVRDRLWRPEYLPLLFSDYQIVVGTGVKDDAPVPVHTHHWQEGRTPPKLPSLGDLICLWIDAIDRGAWTYDVAERRWTWHHGRLPKWIERPALA